MTNCSRSPRSLAAVFCLLFCAAGCGGPSDQPDLGKVEGSITLDGQPLPDATVTFQPEDGRPSFGNTDQQGHYSLRYTVSADGAKTGKHKVRISTARPESDGATKIDETIPARYNSTTELSADVQPGANTFDFSLNSK